MSATHSHAGREVELVTISDSPHEKYRGHDPWTGEKLEHGMPILSSVKSGKVIDKKISYSTVYCPECDIPAEYTKDSEPVCPNCGIICTGKHTLLSEEIIIDAKAAGRISKNDN